MSLPQGTIEALAEHLEEAELNTRAVSKITDQHPDLGWDDAYDIQYEIRRRKLERGSKLIGLKMGLTSRAKMKQMGVEAPIYGFHNASWT
jgi:2-oxo-3-hexenedioate decarboxylase